LDFSLCTLTPEVQCLTFHKNHMVWQTKTTNFWGNGNDSKQDNYFFKIKFVFFLYLLLSASWKENDLSWYISVIRQTVGCRTPVFTQPFSWHFHISLCTLTPEVQCLTFHKNHMVWQTKTTNFWGNGNDSKQAYSVILDIFLIVEKIGFVILLMINKQLSTGDLNRHYWSIHRNQLFIPTMSGLSHLVFYLSTQWLP
jgi:DNA polymerase III psi subunit